MNRKLVAALCAALVLSACGAEGAPETAVQRTSEVRAPSLKDELARIRKDVLARYPGEVAIAVADDHRTVTAGTTQPLQAWSSVKVPIAIAAMDNNPYWKESMEAAITWSDNDSALNLWFSLPDPKAAVVDVLAQAHGTQKSFTKEAGDPTYGAFGELKWSVPEQAQFANHMTCMDGARRVINAMGQIAEDQSYGLGTLRNSHFKGGWGPDRETGQYTARQLGLIRVKGKDVAVAIYASAKDGDYNHEQAMLSSVAHKLAALGELLPEAECTMEDITPTRTSKNR